MMQKLQKTQELTNVIYTFFAGYLRLENENLYSIQTKYLEYGSISSPTGSYWQLLQAKQIWISITEVLGYQLKKSIFGVSLDEMPQTYLVLRPRPQRFGCRNPTFHGV